VFPALVLVFRANDRNGNFVDINGVFRGLHNYEIVNDVFGNEIIMNIWSIPGKIELFGRERRELGVVLGGFNAVEALKV
jgi:hypothetical protein